ncbi:MAG: hypothetical protein QXR58_03100, partial [Candidatus Micrarchaeaceae archaeon]
FIKSGKLNSTAITGPSVFIPGAFERFESAHRSRYIAKTLVGDRIVYFEKPKHQDPKSLLENALSKRSEVPTHLKSSRAKIFVDKVPENLAKLLYRQLVFATTV